MNFKENNTHLKRFILALHSSSHQFGVAVLDLNDPKNSSKLLIFDANKNLSNYLISYINNILPRKNWKEIARIAVATGPGSFTGTRLTVTMARILAQQLDCNLDGISSFYLMAKRLYPRLEASKINKPFWITKELKRRGIIGGEYIVRNENKDLSYKKIIELSPPYLIPSNLKLDSEVKASDDIQYDTNSLLKICRDRNAKNTISPWGKVIPIYPISPVDKYN
tara:strand:+ start:355 stop:1023 length:669 start_codon:yes stop_codon:yes gene_type:complete